jgi:hypothetical protein
VHALTVIERLDIFHDRLPRFGLIAELPMSYELVLQRTEEALHRRVIVAIALPTHAHDHPAMGQHCLVEGGAILVVLIAMDG